MRAVREERVLRLRCIFDRASDSDNLESVGGVHDDAAMLTRSAIARGEDEDGAQKAASQWPVSDTCHRERAGYRRSGAGADAILDLNKCKFIGDLAGLKLTVASTLDSLTVTPLLP